MTIGVSPALQQANVGVPFSVDAVLDGAVNLGAYELALGFDPAFLQVVDVQNGPFLGSSGRAASCLPWTVEGGSVRIVCLTLGPDPGGANGSGVLATFTFLPLQVGGTQIAVQQAIATNPMAGVMSTNLGSEGSATIGPAPPPTKTYTPGPSPTPTITAAPTTPAPTATLGPDAPAIVIDPSSQDVTVGDFFTVDATARNLTNVGAYEFTLQFDPNVLTFSGVTNGTFLGNTGRPIFCPPPTVGDGWIRFGCVSSGSPPGASGTGLLAEITFRASGPGASPLEFSTSALADPWGNTMNAGVSGGSVSVSTASPLSDAVTRDMAVAMSLMGMVGLLIRPTGTGQKDKKRLARVFQGGRRKLGRMKSVLRRAR